VPVIVRKRVVACINALWIEHVMGVEEFATLYLPALRDAANGLARSVMRPTGNTIRGATATKSARAKKP
jgi:hypothetical protein